MNQQLLLLLLPSVLASPSLVTVVSTNNKLHIVDGWLDRQDWVARGNLTDHSLDTGWRQLTIASNPKMPNRSKADSSFALFNFVPQAAS